MDEKRSKVLEIIRKEAILKGKFILSSGKESDYYVDIKKVSLDGTFLDMISDIICDLVISKFRTRNLAGVELGGVPIVSAVILKMRQRGFDSKAIVVRKRPKEHGTQKWIEGPPVKDVVLVEDVITTGTTTLSAIEKLKENHVDVEGVICVVDRGGIRKLLDEKINAVSIFTINEVIF